ncbi:hypothetical protein ABIC65_001533 [Sphingomonas trueperi]
MGAPFIERLRGNVAVAGALAAITAAVVGVADAGLGDLVVEAAIFELHIIVLRVHREARALRDHVDRAAGGVLVPKRPLRLAQHFHPFEVGQRQAGGVRVADIDVV